MVDLSKLNTFFRHGIPPLTERVGSKSKPSVSKEKHDDCTLIEGDFGFFPDDELCRQDTPGMWYLVSLKKGKNPWGSESDIQGIVKIVLETAISVVGFEGEIECFNELSIFDLRPDIWIVCNGGVPIGVVKVKKPGGALESPYVQGQLFDYMLRLQSFFGIKNVFGILTSYDQWRICWLPLSDQAAAATSSAALGTEHAREIETQIVVPERVLQGSKFFAWDDEDLPRALCTVILKMYSSPRSQVSLVDKNRPYIVIDQDQWSWGTISVGNESDLKHSSLPTANKFTLLADLRDGADGRVWRACTDSGLGCCIKFPTGTQHQGIDEVSEESQLQQLRQEEANWHKAYGERSARVTTLSNRPALIMKYLRPLELNDGELTTENLEAVKTAIEEFAAKGLRHDDLALRHLGLLSPAPKKKGSPKQEEGPGTVVLFDLGRVSEEADTTLAVQEMLSQLNLA